MNHDHKMKKSSTCFDDNDNEDDICNIFNIKLSINNKLSMNIPEETLNKLQTNFSKCVNGYHLINDDPIKEAPWEDINSIILKESGCAVDTLSNGSHKSGGDITCSLGCFSNKSTQYKSGNSAFEISSYRLTTVCSDKNPGNITDIISEINKRKNFNYYSIIVRDDKPTNILYDWYLIPADYSALDPSTYTWQPKLGKIGKNKDSVVGWETNTINGSSMSITFSMSSQLWISLNITDDMKKYIVGSCTVTKGRKYNYIDIYNLFTSGAVGTVGTVGAVSDVTGAVTCATTKSS